MQEKKRFNELDKIRHVCECSHTVFVPSKLEFAYCSHCGKRVYRDAQAKFKHKLLIKMGRRSNEQVSQQEN